MQARAAGSAGGVQRWSRMGPVVQAKVWGEFACFTRPEFATERVSYEVMTPGAARGVLESIFWKPEFRWRIEYIVVLSSVRRMSMVHNEVTYKANEKTERERLKRIASGEAAVNAGPYADEAKDERIEKSQGSRTQRYTLYLRDVCYLVGARIETWPHSRSPEIKYREQFLRRLKRGQCFSEPYLGLRECVADFAAPDGDEDPVLLTEDLGYMLFDLGFAEEARAKRGSLEFLRHGADHETAGARVVRGRAVPKFFRATLDRGVLHVPGSLYDELDQEVARIEGVEGGIR